MRFFALLPDQVILSQQDQADVIAYLKLLDLKSDVSANRQLLPVQLTHLQQGLRFPVRVSVPLASASSRDRSAAGQG